MSPPIPITAPPADQAAALRAGAALAELPSHGVYLVAGKDRQDLIHRITTNDVRGLQVGAGNTNCFTTNKGRIVDRVRLLAAEDALLLIASPGRGAAVVSWIDRYTIREDVKVADATEQSAQFGLYGPAARDVAAAELDSRARDLAPGHFCAATAFGTDVTVIRSDDLVLHPGFLLLVPRDVASAFAAALLARAGAALTAVSGEALEAARIEAGMPRYGKDLSEDHHPLESGLWSSVSFTKGCYVGQEVIARLNTYDKVMKNLCRLRADRALEPGTKILASGAAPAEVGVVTSAAGPPWLEEWRALGYVKKSAVAAKAPLLTLDGAPVEILSVVKV